jgi:hypothetical protein
MPTADVYFGRMSVPHFREITTSVDLVPVPVSHVLGGLRRPSISSSVIAGENTPVTIPFVALELRRGVVSVDDWTVRSRYYVQSCTGSQ